MAPFSLEVAVYGQLLQKQTTRRGQLSVISLSRSWAIAGDAIPDGHYAVVDLLHHEAIEIEKIAGTLSCVTFRAPSRRRRARQSASPQHEGGHIQRTLEGRAPVLRQVAPSLQLGDKSLCRVLAWVHLFGGLERMTWSMAVYDYLVTGLEPEMVLEGDAPSDAGAWREAVLLVSEIMRERPVLQSGSFTVKVEVKSQDGRSVCHVEARSNGCR